jgi:hypothetical protein
MNEHLHTRFSSQNVIGDIDLRSVAKCRVCVWGGEKCLQGMGGKPWKTEKLEEMGKYRRAKMDFQ